MQATEDSETLASNAQSNAGDLQQTNSHQSITRRHSDQESHSSHPLPAGLPSYRLHPERKSFSALSAQAKRASTNLYFSPATSRDESAPRETIAKIPTRRSSMGSVRPMLMTARTATSKSATTVEEHESKQHVSMVQHFQIRRMTPPARPERPRTSSTEPTEPGKEASAMVGLVLSSIEQAWASQTPAQSSRLDLRRNSSFHLKRSGRQLDIDLIRVNSKLTARGEPLRTQILAAVTRRARFTLSRQPRIWRRKLRSKWTRFRTLVSTPMSPFSAAAQSRAYLLLAAGVWHILYTPFKFAFGVDDHAWRGYVEAPIELLLIADFLLGFNTSFVDESGQEVVSRKRIAWNYVTGWCFLDLLSSIPIGLVTMHGQRDSQDVLWSGGFQIQRLVHSMLVIRMIWIIRARRARKGFSAWLLYSRFSHLHRIAWVVLGIVYAAHWMPCGWRLLKGADESATLAEDYVANVYDALQLLQGQGLATQDLAQNLFAAFAVLIGSIALAVVFGHVAILISNFNAHLTNYQRKIETIFAIMTKLQLPALLHERIHQYYEHLWREYESLDGQLIQFSKELTHTLELEVLLFKYMAVIMHVPCWHDSSPDFLKQIVLQIQVRVYLPDDYIIRRGEIGDEYYIINRGVCELVTGPDSTERASTPFIHDHKRRHSFQRSSIVYEDSNAKVLDAAKCGSARSRNGSEASEDLHATRLSRGQSFGEMALIMNYQRTADARALTYVEMCVLTRERFQRLLVRYPEDRKRVMRNMLTSTMVNNDAQNVPCPLKNLVQSAFGLSAEGRPISAKHAASLMVEAVNADTDDDSLRFGIGMKARNRLKAAHEQQVRHISHPSVVVPVASESITSAKELTPLLTRVIKESSAGVTTEATEPIPTRERVKALEARMDSVESIQMDMVRSIQQIHDMLKTVKITHDTHFALPEAEAPMVHAPALIDRPLAPPQNVRRVFSAPSLTPQEIADATADQTVKTSLARRHNSQIHVQGHTEPQLRGLRPLLRYMGSIVGIFGHRTHRRPRLSTPTGSSPIARFTPAPHDNSSQAS